MVLKILTCVTFFYAFLSQSLASSLEEFNLVAPQTRTEMIEEYKDLTCYDYSNSLQPLLENDYWFNSHFDGLEDEQFVPKMVVFYFKKIREGFEKHNFDACFDEVHDEELRDILYVKQKPEFMNFWSAANQFITNDVMYLRPFVKCYKIPAAPLPNTFFSNLLKDSLTAMTSNLNKIEHGIINFAKQQVRLSDDLNNIIDNILLYLSDDTVVLKDYLTRALEDMPLETVKKIEVFIERKTKNISSVNSYNFEILKEGIIEEFYLDLWDGEISEPSWNAILKGSFTEEGKNDLNNKFVGNMYVKKEGFSESHKQNILNNYIFSIHEYFFNSYPLGFKINEEFAPKYCQKSYLLTERIRKLAERHVMPTVLREIGQSAHTFLQPMNLSEL